MFKKLLIANRGEISCRIIRTARQLGIATVAIYTEADVESLHVRMADEAVCIGEAAAAQTYLDGARVLAVAREVGANAIHPGYGFLSENAAFAQACAQAGIAFIGPTPEQMRAFGLKHTAREWAQRAKVPLLPGTGLLESVTEALEAAQRIGYPVMLKSTAGGGGIGMRLCRDAAELAAAFAAVKHLSEANFKNSGMYVEKFVERARHVEVQIFGDGKGRVVSLGERDCSVQRRHQKVVEETPAPGLDEATRASLAATAVRLGEAIAYQSAGTVEYVLDADSGAFYFLEVNTRLQVEHGVTEAVFGVDLVEWMIRTAAGAYTLPQQDSLQSRGHAMQLRVYAEDPAKSFQPSSGTLTEVVFGAGIRVDTWVERGTTVSPYYDPLLAKLIVQCDTREQSIAALQSALGATRIDGIETNLAYLGAILGNPQFVEGRQTTQMLAAMPFAPRTLEIIDGGIQTTVQDYPGRLGLWAVGIPPSGPMDAYAHRIANYLVGNAADAACVEMTLQGPSICFHTACRIALAGADMAARASGAGATRALQNWSVHEVAAGETLCFGSVAGAGVRAYLALAGGLDLPYYLDSRSTFILGQFGGHGGRALRAGDVLKLGREGGPPRALPAAAVPRYGHVWDIAVHYGPHGAPEFFTADDIAMFFGTEWQVHFNSSRTGVRLVGPKPRWARTDGGEAGLHPSNIHDNPYAIGSIDFTGDMPVILGPDGPSLGGFVCPAVIVSADLWKIGQLQPGDRLRFVRVDEAQAATLRQSQERLFAGGADAAPLFLPHATDAGAAQPAILHTAQLADGVQLLYRRAGDDYLLIEFGQAVLDINLRFRVHGLMQAIEHGGVDAIIDLTPGIRSLQVHFDHRRLSARALIARIAELAATLAPIENMVVASRIVHLPLAWNDSQTRLTIQKYQTTVRPDAPWCPDNIEFIRRINGLASVQQVYETVFNASYMVLGLGDVYLGAPVATPVDPRHRLVTTKYNPARTWTPENAVGIGGAYLCVYGMEGPGGYQFVGRTVQMWNRYRQTGSFRDGHPWLLRFFDQIRFYEVSEEQLMAHRRDFPLGRFNVRIEETTFSLADYNRFLANDSASIAAFKQAQQGAFDAERERWRASGQAEWISEEANAGAATLALLPAGSRYLSAVVPGSVWQIITKPGDVVAAGDTVAIFESMKMEIAVKATGSGELLEWLVAEGKPVSAGQHIAVFRDIKAADGASAATT